MSNEPLGRKVTRTAGKVAGVAATLPVLPISTNNSGAYIAKQGAKHGGRLAEKAYDAVTGYKADPKK